MALLTGSQVIKRTAAGEFVREEMEHIREGTHGARSTKQAIAIGLSKARRAGVPLQAPEKGAVSSRTRRQAKRDLETGQGKRKPRAPSARRRRATAQALRKEPRLPSAAPDGAETSERFARNVWELAEPPPVPCIP